MNKVIHKNRNLSLVNFNVMCIRRYNLYTQKQFAEIMEIKRSLLGAIEEGRCYPSLDLIIKISALFDLTTDQLLKEVVYEDSVKDELL